MALSPFWLTIITSVMAFLITSLGGAVVFLFKKLNKAFMQLILSFSAGIMIAASFFSLILVAIEHSKDYDQNPAIITTIGVFSGMLFIVFMGIAIERCLINNKRYNDLTDKNIKAIIKY